MADDNTDQMVPNSTPKDGFGGYSPTIGSKDMQQNYGNDPVVNRPDRTPPVEMPTITPRGLNITRMANKNRSWDM